MDPWPLLQTQASDWGMPLTPAEASAMHRFYELLIEGNRRANLTRITDEQEAVVKHFLDSIAVLRALGDEERARPLRFVDVGAGAGLPGIPLLILNPNWSGVMLEATGKKVAFMTEALATLGLNGEAIHGRAEEIGQAPDHREQYDLATARAVAELRVLCELCLPLVKVGGVFVAMKGTNADEEVARAQGALRKLGGSVRTIVRFSLPAGYGERALIVIDKQAPTAKLYPRRAGQPAAKPLC